MDTARLTQLKRSRNPRRKHLEKLLDELTLEIANKQLESVEEILGKIEVKEAELTVLEQELEGLWPEEDFEGEMQATAEFSDRIIVAKIRAKRLIAESKSVAQKSATGSAVTTTTKITAKLPKLQIAKFDGRFIDWNRFSEQFIASIDKNINLSEVDKFSYLRSLLTGPVLATIQGLQLSGSSYKIAWNLLQEKYGQPSILKNEHLHSLMRIKAVTWQEDGADLRRFYEECQSHVRALEVLGVQMKTVGITICPILFQALPSSLLREWNRKYPSSQDEEVEVLLQFIHEELKGIEKAWRAKAMRSRDSKQQAEVNKNGNRQGATSKKSFPPASASALTTSTGKNEVVKSNKTRRCLFCGSVDHWSSYCEQVATYDGRIAALRQAKRCFRCLNDSHFSRECNNHPKCRKCKGDHHTLLCRKSLENTTQNVATSGGEKTEAIKISKSKESSNSCQGAVASTTTTSVISGQPAAIALQTLRLRIRKNNKEMSIIALLDGGSERSFVCKHVVDELRLDISSERSVNIHTFGGHSQRQDCHLVKVPLKCGSTIMIVEALEVQQICQGVLFWEESEVDKVLQFPKIENWKVFAQVGKPEKVDMLIGSDLYWQIVTGQMKRLGRTLMAINTVFGWTIQGKIDYALQSNKNAVSLHVSASPELVFGNKEDDFRHANVNSKVSLDVKQSEQFQEKEASMEDLMQKLWQLEDIGRIRASDCEKTLEEVEVMEDFEKRISFVNNRYSVGIPWNHHKEDLCVNYGIAINRLKRLLLRLKQDPQLFNRYSEGMQTYLNMDHIELVQDPEKTEGPIYYMPHQPVIKEDRITMKLRIVFDASSKAKGHFSLNDCQSSGPNLNPNIFDMLLRFRQHRIGITSDVEKAFLQVLLNEEDRDATRFFWIEEQELGKQKPTLKVFRMTRVLFGMKSSPFLLAATIRHHARKFKNSHPTISESLNKDTYVDDHLSGSNTVEEGYKIFQETQDIMAQGSMMLKKWTSNSQTLMERWHQEKVITPEEIREHTKVLGLLWNTSSDDLLFQKVLQSNWKEEEINTKRAMLRIAAKIFDPLGILGPVMLEIKFLLQETWRMKVSWDEPLQEAIVLKWRKWLDDLHLLESIRIPRWTHAIPNQKKELHIFCDASPKGYGAVAYLRNEEKGGWDKCQLIAAKSKIAPIQLVSIPRLELLACVIGAQLGSHIIKVWKEMDNTVQFFWTDSKVALSWLSATPSRWKMFVARRVQLIQECTEKQQWNYCNGKHNPADILSRGCSLSDLLKNQVWWGGPKFLGQGLVPFEKKEEEIVDVDLDLIKEEEQEIAHLQHIRMEEQVLFDSKKFGSWRKLVRVTAWMLRFIRNCQKQEQRKTGNLSSEEWKASEEIWFRQIQRSCFPDELAALCEKRPLSKQSRLRQLSPFLDENGLIRLGGRLEFAKLSFAQKHPIILSQNHAVLLLILHCHQEMIHGGVGEVLTKLRETVWVLRARQEVRKALKQCLVCRRWEARPGAEIDAPLPEERVCRSKAFENSGIDFFGPLFAKDGIEVLKVYGCIFTCAVTRAVHLELTLSQETEAFLQALRRFLARRGKCAIVWSDNAKNFKQADILLKRLYEATQSKEVQDFSAEKGIVWKFIAPRASWWGGFYERMIGIVKHHLRRSLGQARLSIVELQTLFTEVEAVVNARPLTYVSEDPSELDYLTPGMFLLQGKSCGLQGYLKAIPEFPRSAFTRRWRYQSKLLEGFWNRWKKEYLLALRTAHQRKWPDGAKKIQKGDVVIIQQDKIPRGAWKMARVQEVTIGRDGKVRSVMLKTASGDLLRRAIQQVYPLEVLDQQVQDEPIQQTPE